MPFRCSDGFFASNSIFPTKSKSRFRNAIRLDADIVIESIEQLAAIEQAAREARPRLEAARKHIDAMIASIEEQPAAARRGERRALNPLVHISGRGRLSRTRARLRYVANSVFRRAERSPGK